MSKKIFIIILMALFFVVGKNSTNVQTNSEENLTEYESQETVATIQDIEIKQLDNTEKNYVFIYNNEEFYAIYSKDNWKIKDSYKINNKSDMKVICQALLDIHQIHGKDMISYRTAEDLVREWIQHNLAYELLSKNSPWKENAKDVDFDPKDQGKSIIDMYKSRTNK